MDFDSEVAPVLISAGDKIRDEFFRRFETLRAANDPAAFSFDTGFGYRAEDLGPQGYAPSAPIKFAFRVRNATQIVGMYLPHFSGLNRVYEIGVGAGYLLRALIDVHGIDAKGCDVRTNSLNVYTALREELGVNHLVEEQKILAGVPIQLPEGTEAVTAFMSVFDFEWKRKEYDWFVQELRNCGVKKLLWRANRTDETIREFLLSIGGEFPEHRDDNRFAVVPL